MLLSHLSKYLYKYENKKKKYKNDMIRYEKVEAYKLLLNALQMLGILTNIIANLI